MKEKKFYDSAFAELFHNPKFIRSLLLDFIDEPWVHMLDLSSMRIEEGEHKKMNSKTLRNDLIISFDFAAAEPLSLSPGFSIYLLIEFQSTHEQMAHGEELIIVKSRSILIAGGSLCWPKG